VTRERRLAEAFIVTADTLGDDFDVTEYLLAVAEQCVELLDVDAAVMMLADERGTLNVQAATSEPGHLLGLFELQADAGPCLDAHRSGGIVANADLRSGPERWPRFGEAAQATGFVAVHALPMRLRAAGVGVMGLLRTRPGPLDGADVRAGQALADVAAIGIVAWRAVHRAELVTAQLQQALVSRVAIEQAKGILSERRRISADEAFGVLRDHARSHNLHLSQLAQSVTDRSGPAADLLRTPGPGPVLDPNPSGAQSQQVEAD
jgi:hypothetical protein